MASTEGRRAHAVPNSAVGKLGSHSGAFFSSAPARGFSANVIGQALGSRARPTTQEIIAEAFGRRLHGLELLSVKKLNALNASAAKLEAHVASRAAAISRTSGAAETALGAGVAGAAGLTGASAPKGDSAGGGGGDGGQQHSAVGGGADGVGCSDRDSSEAGGGCAAEEKRPLSPMISVALPATLLTGPQGFLGSCHQQGPEHIAERGGQVVRLLALQDRVLHAALSSQHEQQHSMLVCTSPSASQPHSLSQSQLQLPLPPSLQLLSPTSGSRFQILPNSEAGGGALSPEELRRLDVLGIKHDSKVAAAAVRLFRLTPRGMSEWRSSSQLEAQEGAPATPPNTQRGDFVVPSAVGLAAESSDAMRGHLSSGSRRQLGHSREFKTMAKFMESLQDEDEVSLAQQARDFARFNSSAPSQSQSLIISLHASPSRAATAPMAQLPSLQPSATQRAAAQPQSSVLRSDDPLAEQHPQPRPHPPPDPAAPRKHLTLELPESPIVAPAGISPASGLDGVVGTGTSPGAGPIVSPGLGSIALGRSPARSATGGTGSRLVTPRRPDPWMSPEIDYSSVSTGQGRSKDLLDGLMKAVEMFVGAGAGVAPGSAPGLGGASRSGRSRMGVGREEAPGAGGRESPFEQFPEAAAAAADADDEPGKEPQEPHSAVPPYSGVYGSPEKLIDRVRKKGALAVLSNPAGYREEVAAGEVALYQEVAEQCRDVLARSARHPRDQLLASELKRLVADLHFCRPFFVGPRETLPELMAPLRPVSAAAVARQNTQYAQSAPRESVFLPRAVESESEDMIDTNAIRERQVRKDWNRVVRKDAFRALVGSDDPGAVGGTTGLGHALDACLAVILRHKDSLKAVFTYYSMKGTGFNDYCFALGLQDWRAFVADCGLGGPPVDNGGRVGTPVAAAAAAAATAASSGVAAGVRPSVMFRGLPPTPSGATAQQPTVAGASAAGVPKKNAKGPGKAGASTEGGKHAAAVGGGRGGGPASASGGGASPTKSRLAADGGVGVGGSAGGAAGSGRVSVRLPTSAVTGMVIPAAAAAPPGGAFGGRMSMRAQPLQGGPAGAPASASGSGVPRASVRPVQLQGVAAGPGGGSGGGGGVGPSSGGVASSSPVSLAVADAVFAAVNVDPEKRVIDGQVVLNRSVLRFEWYELLLRLATVRHVKGGQKCGSIASALEHMWTVEVLPALKHAAVHEPNMWRVVRLYGDPEVNELFIAHMDVITALYDLFSAASKNQLMHLSDWIGLLNTCSIIGDATGVTLHAAKLAYCRSLCVVVDEQSHWGRAVCLSRCGFMEAIARLAEELAPPPLEEVADTMREAGITGRRLRAALEQPWIYYYNELPVELLVSRRLAAAEAAAARSTATGDDSALPSLQNSTTRLDMPSVPAPAISTSAATTVPSARVAASIVSAPSSPRRGPPALPSALPASSAPSVAPSVSAPSSWNALPKLSFRLEALLELLLGRLREHWECANNQQLADRLRDTAASLQLAP